MGKKRKRKSLPPRRHRLDRRRRLQSARHWLESFRFPRPAGRALVYRYAKWYRVDLICALKELELLEIPIDATDAQRLREALARPNPKKRPKAPATRPERRREVAPIALSEMGVAMTMFDFAVADAEEGEELPDDLNWWDFL